MFRKEDKPQEEVMESCSLALSLAAWQCVGVLPSHAPSVQSRPFGFGHSLPLTLFDLLVLISIILYYIVLSCIPISYLVKLSFPP